MNTTVGTRPKPKENIGMIVVMFIAQLLSLAVLLYGDIGFDHPGRFGLSFDHGIFVTAVYVVALISGLACSYSKRNWKIAVPQVLIPLLLCISFARPAPHYDAVDYQHLIGQTRSEVEEQLSPRNTFYGAQMVDDVETEFVSYEGMTIYYSQDGVVIKVESQ